MQGLQVCGPHVCTSLLSTPSASAFASPLFPGALVGGFFFESKMPHALTVETRRVEALIPYAKNPRTHSDAQIAQIAAWKATRRASARHA